MSAIDGGSERLGRLFRMQAEGCRRLGSPMYGVILDEAANEIENGSRISGVLEGHENDPGPSALALRLMGAVHRLVLEGRAPELGRFYPSVGGRPDGAAMWPVFASVVASHSDVVRTHLESPPQTNEVGRSAALLGGLLHVARRTDRPIRLLEIGASAGLNLRVDRFRFDISDDVSIGPPDSAVRLEFPWAPGGTWPPTDAGISIAERAGCDTDPIDVTTEDGRLRLLSYVWPDQIERVSRLRNAFTVADDMPLTVERSTADEFLSRELRSPRSGAATVVWHSIVWQYIAAVERAAIDDLFAEAGARATADSPLARIALEPRRRGDSDRFAFTASLTYWPGGAEEILGTAGGHGPPVRWA